MSVPKVYNTKEPKFSSAAPYVYVGRPSKWGNPFKIGLDGTREEVVEKYRQYLFTSNLIDDVYELMGCNLVCHCAPLPCHADVLLELANME